MRITDVTAYTLSSPIEPPDERQFYGGTRRILKRDVVLVVIEDATGETGYATAGASSSEMREYFEDIDHESTAEVISEMVGPVLSDEPIESIAAAGERILSIPGLDDQLRREVSSAVDVALHDLVGKREGVPVYELLAPEIRDPESLPLYASAGMYMDAEGYARQAAAISDLGYFGYKYRPGGGPDHDRQTLETIRDRVGDDLEIMIDAHTWWKLGDHSYDVDQVVELLEDFAVYNPYWVEEPVQPDAHHHYVAVANRTSVPLAGGESEPSPNGLKALGDTGAVRFLQADVRHHGGFTGCWDVAMYCAANEIRFVPHNFGTHLGLVANAHLVAAAPDADLLEYPMFGTGTEAMYPFPLAEEILETDLGIENGTLDVPTDPGLGVEINTDVLDDYPPIAGPWTEFEYE